MDAGAWQLIDGPGVGWEIAAPRNGVGMDLWGRYSFRSCWDMSALGSVLPRTLHGGLSQSSAWESLPAPARGQIDVLHGTMLGHPSIQLEVRTNLFHQNFCLWECTGETAKY